MALHLLWSLALPNSNCAKSLRTVELRVMGRRWPRLCGSEMFCSSTVRPLPTSV